MCLKNLLFVGLLIPTIIARKYTNETWQSIDNVYNNCWEVVKDYPTTATGIGTNMMKSYKVYTLQLADLADNNSTILSDSAVLMLDTLALLETLKYSPENILIECEKVLPKMSAQMRQIVSMQRGSIGKVTDHINNDIKSLERLLMRLLNDFTTNGISNLALGKKRDFEPVMKCLQKLTNKIGQISETALNDASLCTESVEESVLILSIILAHCYVFVTGTKSTFAAIVHSKRKRIPPTLNSCLESIDALSVLLTKALQSIRHVGKVALRTLLKSLVSLNNFLNATLESVFGLTTGVILTVDTVVEGLLSGVSSITRGLNKLGP